jgi:hypothetical protein
VCPSIAVSFETLKESDLIDGDFYLADLLSENNKSVRKTLKVILQEDVFFINVERIDRLFKEVVFKDGGRAHNKFWTKYERPPAKEYWNYMLC